MNFFAEELCIADLKFGRVVLLVVKLARTRFELLISITAGMRQIQLIALKHFIVFSHFYFHLFFYWFSSFSLGILTFIPKIANLFIFSCKSGSQIGLAFKVDELSFQPLLKKTNLLILFLMYSYSYQD